jgi:hypothetical protein
MVAKRHKITNVPLFKKLWDIIFFWGDNNFLSHFSGHFEGASTFLTPKLSLEMAQKVIVPQKKNYVPQFLKQQDINSCCIPEPRWAVHKQV